MIDLRAQREILEHLFDHIPAMISIVGPDGRVTFANRVWEQKLGWTLEDGQCADFCSRLYTDPNEHLRVRAALAAGDGEWVDSKLTVRDGHVIDAAWAAHHLSDETSICIGIDNTASKRTEERLRATSEQLRALSARVLTSAEEERTRISREIHDELGSSLASLKWDLEALDRALSKVVSTDQASLLRASVGVMLKRADDTAASMRRIASELRPSLLDDLGLTAAIEWQAQQFAARTGIPCRCDASQQKVNLNPEQSTAVFRIAQEALTNILRHAKATRVDIVLEQQEAEFILTIRDNGRGMPGRKNGRESLGLLGMEERSHLAGGKLEISSLPGGGTTVTVRVKTTEKEYSRDEEDPHHRRP